MTAQLLGFDGPTLNSMDSVADRDYLIESALGDVHDHDAFKPFLRGDHNVELE